MQRSRLDRVLVSRSRRRFETAAFREISLIASGLARGLPPTDNEKEIPSSRLPCRWTIYGILITVSERSRRQPEFLIHGATGILVLRLSVRDSILPEETFSVAADVERLLQIRIPLASDRSTAAVIVVSKRFPLPATGPQNFHSIPHLRSLGEPGAWL